MLQCMEGLMKKSTVTGILLVLLGVLIIASWFVPPPPPPQYQTGSGQQQGTPFSSGPCDLHGNYGGSYTYKKLTAAPLVRYFIASEYNIYSASSLLFIPIVIVHFFFFYRGEH